MSILFILKTDNNYGHIKSTVHLTSVIFKIGKKYTLTYMFIYTDLLFR